MPPYAYPIEIKRNKQTIHFDEIKEIESNTLTLEMLAFIGNDSFIISDYEHDSGIGSYREGYRINVSRSRLETDEEQNTRIQREESYMAEYNKRQMDKFNKK